MRVIAGVAKGRRLKAPPDSFVLRPTSDKVREAVFDIIGPAIEGSGFLDLFSGTGAVGIEALSRGARDVVFVESKPLPIALIKANLALCGFARNFELIRSDALQAMATLEKGHRRFAFIFIDPPYDSDLAVKSLERIAGGGLLLPSTRILVEHSIRKPVPEKVGGLVSEREYTFGDTMINLYHYIES